MMRVLVLGLVSALCALQVVRAGNAPEIFLPQDAEAVTVIGNGFSLQINQLNNIRDQWKDVSDEASSVPAPRYNNDNPEDSAISNNDLYEKTINTVGAKNYGFLDDDLLDWITERARNLMGKIERYDSEAIGLRGDERLVVKILLLNTLTDLENLVKENIQELKWIKKKMRIIGEYRNNHVGEVKEWLQSKIQDNIKIEQKIKSTNKPTKEWLKNTAQIKRVLHEQRFSDEISNTILGYIGGTFSMMKRSTVFDLNRTSKNLNDGLYYMKAKGKVPAHFPFYAQDAIMDEA